MHVFNLLQNTAGFLRRFRDPIRVPRISNRVPRIRENYHRVLKIRENRVPRIIEIGSLQIHTGFLINLKYCIHFTHVFPLKTWNTVYILLMFWAVYFGGVSTNPRLPSLMTIFAGDASLYSRCMFQLSFVWSYKVIFSEK